MTKSTTADDRKTIGIIGAGIVGTATALSLVRKGYDVTLIDPQVRDRAASYGNGGALNPSSVVPVTVPGLLAKAPRMMLDPSSPLFLRWSYLPRLLPWLVRYLSHCRASETLRIAKCLAPLLSDSLGEHQALAEGTGAERFLHATDFMVVYEDRAKFEADDYVWSLRKQLGIDWEIVDVEAYKRLEPALADRSYLAIRLPEHGFVSDPGRYVATLIDSFRELGGTVIEDEALDFVFEGDQASVMLISQRRLDFATLVIAAGAWSGQLVRKFGLSVPLESERGYHVEFFEPSSMPIHPTVIAAGQFIATPMDGRLRCAGVVEFGGLEMPANKAPTDLIIKRVKETFPNMQWKEMRTWLGHRPALTDSLPIIGRAPGRDNVILAFGHHHVGMAAGAKTGRMVANLVTGHNSGIDLTPYRADRF